MLSAIFKAIGQVITDPKLRSIVFKGIFGAFSIFIILWLFSAYGLSNIIWQDLPYIGSLLTWITDFSWLLSALETLSLFAFGSVMLTVTFILFPPIMTVIIGIFLDDVCKAVEARHYPNAGATIEQRLLDSIYNAIRFLSITITINILILPLYILTWWFFGFGFLVYYLVNGYLVGREYFELVALRRMDMASAAGLRRAHRGRIMLAGVITVFAMTIPIVNLIAPILSAAAMVHIFMNLNRRDEFSRKQSNGNPNHSITMKPQITDNE